MKTSYDFLAQVIPSHPNIDFVKMVKLSSGTIIISVVYLKPVQRQPEIRE